MVERDGVRLVWVMQRDGVPLIFGSSDPALHNVLTVTPSEKNRIMEMPAVAAVPRRQRLRNKPLAQKPGNGMFQYVYDMNGCELCAVGREATLAEVHATVLRMLNLTRSMADTVRLERVEASPSSEATYDWQVVLDSSAMLTNRWIHEFEPPDGLCEICFGVLGEESCSLVSLFDACELCQIDSCCSRCLHRWQSQPMKNDHGEEVKPGASICALCITPAMLDAEAACVTRHFRIAALANMYCEE